MNNRNIKSLSKPHPEHGFMMPVKLDFYGSTPIPKVRNGQYVYALPGGGEYAMIEPRSDLNP